jgi:hypothetical protein
VPFAGCDELVGDIAAKRCFGQESVKLCGREPSIVQALGSHVCQMLQTVQPHHGAERAPSETRHPPRRQAVELAVAGPPPWAANLANAAAQQAVLRSDSDCAGDDFDQEFTVTGYALTAYAISASVHLWIAFEVETMIHDFCIANRMSAHAHKSGGQVSRANSCHVHPFLKEQPYRYLVRPHFAGS